MRLTGISRRLITIVLCTALNPVVVAAPDNGLVGYWTLQGDCQDHSGNGIMVSIMARIWTPLNSTVGGPMWKCPMHRCSDLLAAISRSPLKSTLNAESTIASVIFFPSLMAISAKV